MHKKTRNAYESSSDFSFAVTSVIWWHWPILRS